MTLTNQLATAVFLFSDTGLPFLDHMIDQLGTHGMLDLSVTIESRKEGSREEDVNNAVGAAIGAAIAELGLSDSKVYL